MPGRQTWPLTPHPSPHPTSGPGGRCTASTRSACCFQEHPTRTPPGDGLPALLGSVTARRCPSCSGPAGRRSLCTLPCPRVLFQILLSPSLLPTPLGPGLQTPATHSSLSRSPGLFPPPGELAFSCLRGHMSACVLLPAETSPVSGHGCGGGSGPGRTPLPSPWERGCAQPGVGLNTVGVEKQHCAWSVFTFAATWREVVSFVTF